MSMRFTDRELDVMAVLWDEGSATARTVHDRLEDDLAYTTVVNVLRTMAEKGYVRREQEGRAHRFFPDVARSRASASAVDRLVSKFFSGSADRLLAHLVESERVSPEDIEALRARLERAGRDDVRDGEQGPDPEEGSA